jgi:hypothetical protein
MIMFGKPQWFRPKTIGWGVVPVTWQGWGYTAGWTGAIVTPFLLLVSREQPLEALAWLGLGIGSLAWDVKQLRRGMGLPAPRRTVAAVPVGAPKNEYVAPKKEDNVLYILDDNAGAPIATKNYRLQVQR